MNKKKKIIAILSIVILTIIGISLVSNVKEGRGPNDINGPGNSETISKYENKLINWEEIVNVKFSGFEGNPSIEITYNEIPEFEERLSAEKSGWDAKKAELSEKQDKEEIQKFLSFVSEFDSSRDWCSLPEDYKNIKNGDELIFNCGNSTLEALNYSYDKTYKVTVEGVWKDETPKLKEPAKDTNLSNEIVNEKEHEIFAGTIKTENGVQYWDLDNIMVITTEDLNKVELDNIETDIVLKVPAEMLDETISYAKDNDIEYIQVDDKVYTGSSNFDDYMEWRGIAS